MMLATTLWNQHSPLLRLRGLFLPQDFLAIDTYHLSVELIAASSGRLTVGALTFVSVGVAVAALPAFAASLLTIALLFLLLAELFVGLHDVSTQVKHRHDEANCPRQDHRRDLAQKFRHDGSD